MRGEQFAARANGNSSIRAGDVLQLDSVGLGHSDSARRTGGGRERRDGRLQSNRSRGTGRQSIRHNLSARV